MTDQELRLQIAEVAGTWIAALAVVIGGIFGVFQYLEHKDAVKVDRTMAFVERYHSDGLLTEARLKITHSMASHVDDINQLLTNPEIDPNDIANQYNLQVNKFIEQDELAGYLEQIFTFYEQIILCRELSLCDPSVAEQFFDTDGLAFIRTFYPYICNVRKKWNNPDKYDRVLNFYVRNSANICET
ncbi:DUF4760 domain-containing protein [Aliiglaciecola lipolytica]|uniref:DUF4760 domain-containing protein n=1 Tax=Aliiglaciecola lipolytica E3 TaxID=1127673 RepID=K6XQ68_9ALTE|nr:hypothetical protein [Aliiglaciecola lipolytica]GAC13796.1 hypothetical protein GLIP_1155 [Aliiglaciecola lipolytica E3]